jgi:hypothetical protein
MHDVYEPRTREGVASAPAPEPHRPRTHTRTFGCGYAALCSLRSLR